MYWTTNYYLSTPFFGQIMTELRFSLIMKYLHFDNEDKEDRENNGSSSKLRKFYNLYQLILNNFQKVYIPEREVCIDENLLTFKGRLSWKQYISSKRARFGIKTFVLCEASSGYTVRSKIM
jgi:hypothetical protein